MLLCIVLLSLFLVVNGPVEAYDKTSKGCKPNFYMNGLPELKWEGIDICTTTLEYSEPLELDLTCVFMTSRDIFRRGFEPLRLFFQGMEKSSEEINKNKTIVSAMVIINAEHNKEEIKCTANKKTSHGPYEQSLIIKLHHLPTTTSTTTKPTVITDKPEHYEVAAGSPATFRCNANADPSLKLQVTWLYDGREIDFESQPRFKMTNDHSLLISDTTELDSGEYTCIAKTEIDETRAQATLTVQGPVEAYDKTSKGCKPNFYMNGLPELKWEGTDICTTTLEYSEPLELDLTCVFMTSRDIFRRGFEPLRLFFQGMEKSSEEINKNKTIVSAMVIINAEHNKEEIKCTANKKTSHGPYEQSLIIKLHHLPTTTSTTTKPTVITDKPEHYEVAAGSPATFRCNANADPSLKLQVTWLYDGREIDFESQPRFKMTNDHSLLISDTTELDSGEYTCIAKTEIDETRAQATLTVQDNEAQQKGITISNSSKQILSKLMTKCGPVEAYDKTSKGCKPNFYMNGLPELKWEGIDICTTTLEYSGPLELDLTCVFLNYSENNRRGYEPLRLFFQGMEKSSEEINKNKTTVSAKVIINAEHNKEEIKCTAIKKTSKGPYEQSLTIKLHHLPTTTSTTTKRTVITDKPEHYEVAAGAPATLRCNANANPSLKLQVTWLYDGREIDFESQPRFKMTNDYSLLISDTSELDSGEYTCIAKTEIDETRAQATLTVQDKSPTTKVVLVWVLVAAAGVIIVIVCLYYYRRLKVAKEVAEQAKNSQALEYSYVPVEKVPVDDARALIASNKRIGPQNFIPRVPPRPGRNEYDYATAKIPTMQLNNRHQPTEVRQEDIYEEIH